MLHSHPGTVEDKNREMARWGMRSCMGEVLPFVAMLMVVCVEVSALTLVKAAMNSGMSNLVYIVYHNALGTILFLPFFIIHRHRGNRLPLTFPLLFRFFILGLLGVCVLQVLSYVGVNYSSPTLATALGNLIPAYTFLLAVIFRMEKLDLRNSSSQAKSLGTILAISGAFVLTFYEGPPIQIALSHNPSDHLHLSQQNSNWVLGALILAMTGIVSSCFNVFQTATVREYPDEITIVFFIYCFGTVQTAILSLFAERNPSTWVLHSGIEKITIAFGAVFCTGLHTCVLTWCLHKKGPVYVAMFTPISMVIAVIMGIMFLGDTLHLGSVLGAIIIAVGFYTVVWGQAEEEKVAMDNGRRPESPAEHAPLLPSKNESAC